MKNKKIIVIFYLLCVIMVIIDFGINIFNERTAVNLRDEDMSKIYNEYSSTKKEIDKILLDICYYDSENKCHLKEQYDSDTYNSLLMHISNYVNSSQNLLLIDKESITYDDLNFYNRLKNIKSIFFMFTDEDNLIGDYAKTAINIITINSEETYYKSKKLFNINGKTNITNDCKEIIETENELNNYIYNILSYIQQNL